MKFKRILLKLSGESLMGEQGHGIDTKRLSEYAAQTKEAQAMGIEIGIVGSAVTKAADPAAAARAFHEAMRE